MSGDIIYTNVTFVNQDNVVESKVSKGHEEVTYSGVKTAVGQQVKDSKPFSGDSSQVVGSKVVTPELGSHRVALVMLLGVCFLLLCLAITLGALYASIFTSYQAKKASFQTCLAQQKNETVKQCDTGWQFFNRSCYYFSDDKLTWEESQYACIHDGGHLVIIESLQEQEFLRIKVGNPGYTDSPWIGMTDQETEGTWVWVDNTILNDNNKYWDQNNGINPEPNNWDRVEHCAGMGKRCSDQTPCWFDFNCVTPLKRICESRAATP